MAKDNKRANVYETGEPGVYAIQLAAVELPDLNPVKLKKTTDLFIKYGKKNDFPQYLVESAGKSPEHEAFIGLRQNLISGEGFSYSEEIAAAILEINEDGESANDLLESWRIDLSILETFAAQVVYDTNGAIAGVYYMDSGLFRPSRKLGNDNKPIGYYYCEDWGKDYKTAEFFPRFDPKNPPKPADGAPENSQVYFYHKPGLLQPYLPKVSYTSGLTYVELSYEVGVYGISVTKNGFFSGGILSANTNMSPKQKAEFIENLRGSYQGTGNANKLIFINVQDPKSVSFTPYSTTDHSPLMKALDELATAKICTAHRGNPQLAGIHTGGASLGGDGNSYRVALEIFQNTVIRPLQKPIIAFLTKVLQHKNYKDFNLDIISLAVISSQMPDEMKNDYIKPSRIVQEYGYSEEDIRPAIKKEELEEEVETLEAIVEIEKRRALIPGAGAV